MPKFSTHVALMSPEYHAVSFAPGDEVPEWAIDSVGEHVLEPEEAGDAEDQDDAPDPDADDDTDGDDTDAPPADEQPDFTAAAPARRRGRAQK